MRPLNELLAFFCGTSLGSLMVFTAAWLGGLVTALGVTITLGLVMGVIGHIHSYYTKAENATE